MPPHPPPAAISRQSPAATHRHLTPGAQDESREVDVLFQRNQGVPGERLAVFFRVVRGLEWIKMFSK